MTDATGDDATSIGIRTGDGDDLIINDGGVAASVNGVAGQGLAIGAGGATTR